jgi:hypothetical protein
MVERMLVPGAKTSTLATPKFEIAARVSASSEAPTQMALAAFALHGNTGRASLSLPPLPAATTYSAWGFAPMTSRKAASSPCVCPAVSGRNVSDAETTRAPAAGASSKASSTSSSVPSPVSSSTRSGIT